MRYKKEIWDYYIKYTDEKNLLDLKRKKGNDEYKPFYDMNEDEFLKHLYNFTWLSKYNSSHNAIISEELFN